MLYLYSGEDRKASIAEWLKFLKNKYEVEDIIVEEVDLLTNPLDDLEDSTNQDLWEGKVSAGQFDVIIVTPPCGSYSRIVWSNTDGPPPCRSSAFPKGFPWATGSTKARLLRGNLHVNFAIRILNAAAEAEKVWKKVIRCI